MRIDHDKFTLIEEFPLFWRWNSSTHTQLPEAVLRQIRPLPVPRAAELDHDFRRFLSGQNLGGPSLGSVFRIEATDPAKTSKRLASAVGSFSGDVVVSWSAELAVVVPWALFLSYWDDFCYPSSDDVTVVPIEEQWVLLYHHDEAFEFAERAA